MLQRSLQYQSDSDAIPHVPPLFLQIIGVTLTGTAFLLVFLDVISVILSLETIALKTMFTVELICQIACAEA